MAESTGGVDVPDVVKTKADRLREPFAPNVERKNPKGMTYIPISEVIARLNRALGEDKWSYRVEEVREHGTVETTTGNYPKWLTANVTLRIDFGTGDPPVERTGFGGQEVQFYKGKDNKPSQGPLDLGDAFKGAVSDALKKAAMSAGVALYLARTEDGLQDERLAREADEPKAAPDLMEKVAGLAKALKADSPDDGYKRFVTWWMERTGGKKFDSGYVTVIEADEALQRLESVVGD